MFGCFHLSFCVFRRLSTPPLDKLMFISRPCVLSLTVRRLLAGLVFFVLLVLERIGICLLPFFHQAG